MGGVSAGVSLAVPRCKKKVLFFPHKGQQEIVNASKQEWAPVCTINLLILVTVNNSECKCVKLKSVHELIFAKNTMKVI